METWNLSWALRNLVAELLMPPGIWLLCILLAVVFLNKRQIFQKTVISISVILIWVSGTPIFANWLIHISDGWMKWPTPISLTAYTNQKINKKTAAIVILGGGRRKGAIESPDYQNQDLSPASLERLRMGVRLARVSQLPILLTGGAPDQTTSHDLPEAVVMAKILREEFSLQEKWLETRSQTTQENAKFTADLLRGEGIHEIYLVTHFWHMPRAQKIFEQYGLKVIPVPHGFYTHELSNPTDFYPNKLKDVRDIWHEILGMCWYRLRY